METEGFESQEQELMEQVRPLVNEILERFNAEKVNPKQAGAVIMALLHRVLGVLKENPEIQRYFALSVLNLMNQHLEGALTQTDSPCPPCQT
jgi:hypothetical protein